MTIVPIPRQEADELNRLYEMAWRTNPSMPGSEIAWDLYEDAKRRCADAAGVPNSASVRFIPWRGVLEVDQDV